MRSAPLVLLACALSACAGDPPTQPGAPSQATPTTVTPGTPHTGVPSAPQSPAPTPSTQGGATTLVLSADTICLQAAPGADPAPDDVRITASDGSAVAGLLATVSYVDGQPAGWLTATFDRDSTPARLWLRAGAGALPEGEYAAQVTVTAPGAGPSVVIKVIRKVRPLELRTLVVFDRSSYVGDAFPGGGRVTGPGIDCTLTQGYPAPGSGDCVAQYPVGTQVTLTATPDARSRFYSWTAPCPVWPPDQAPTCSITITDSTRVGAAFLVMGYSIGVTMQGIDASGDVDGSSGPSDIHCRMRNGAPAGGPCATYVFDGTRGFGFSVRPLYGSVFLGWSGDCSGTNCSLSPKPGGAYAVIATFARDPAIGNRLKVTPYTYYGTTAPTRGRVTGPGIDCLLDGSTVSGTCEADQPLGATVTLSATTDAAGTVSWDIDHLTSPPCTDPADPFVCRVVMQGPREVTAGFRR